MELPTHFFPGILLHSLMINVVVVFIHRQWLNCIMIPYYVLCTWLTAAEADSDRLLDGTALTVAPITVRDCALVVTITAVNALAFMSVTFATCRCCMCAATWHVGAGLALCWSYCIHCSHIHGIIDTADEGQCPRTQLHALQPDRAAAAVLTALYSVGAQPCEQSTDQ